ncbi:hypothetical protein NOSIN_00410 [Nocardiopsis sinuspersici]|uniref:Uncharacterized protein n=1 Tax=Nocardiopsis sinuspersici TaxID=501010 RepID=A0A1V3BWC9_9ACTN|nr:hypothetical protein NOSIN_00410 [Nocardiopsis sinuspersici]
MIVHDTDDQDRVRATFKFYPTPENLGADSGSYALTGNYQAGHLLLDPDYWIDNPGYRMVGLNGELEDADTLTGAMGSDTCGPFSVQRISDEADPPPPED